MPARLVLFAPLRPAPRPPAAPVSYCNLTAAQLGRIVERSSAKHGVPPWLVLTVMYEESRLQPCVTSSMSASGLMQVTPILAKGLGVANHHDPEQNVDAATRFLAMLMKRYRGHVPSVMRAYKGLPVDSGEPDSTE